MLSRHEGLYQSCPASGLGAAALQGCLLQAPSSSPQSAHRLAKYLTSGLGVDSKFVGQYLRTQVTAAQKKRILTSTQSICTESCLSALLFSYAHSVLSSPANGAEVRVSAVRVSEDRQGSTFRAL